VCSSDLKDALFLCQNAEISSLKISVLHGEKML